MTAYFQCARAAYVCVCTREFVAVVVFFFFLLKYLCLSISRKIYFICSQNWSQLMCFAKST